MLIFNRLYWIIYIGIFFAVSNNADPQNLIRPAMVLHVLQGIPS